jgi:hypothetical protein
MITEFLLILFRDILLTGIAILPNAGPLPSGIQNGFSLFSNYFNIADKIFPVSTVFQIIGIGLTFEAGILFFKIINFTIKKLRGSG